MVSSARLNWMKWEKIRIRVRVEMRVRIAIMIEIGTRMENEQIRGHRRYKPGILKDILW